MVINDKNIDIFLSRIILEKIILCNE